MGFQYGREKRKFEKEWEKLEQEYIEAGMSKESVESMRVYDWSWFCSQRIYYNRTQNLPLESYGEECERSSLMRKFSSLFVQPVGEDLFSGRLEWVNMIENAELYRRLCKLDSHELELLTMIIFEGYKQSEAAKVFRCSRSAVSQKLKKIKKILEIA
ncbi:sigma factor-like helix-turn-helix DNA-binding protein [Eisenbergiella porci]|uniref:sigma factor-like helix-turn-helix DNA-binding protein n=1 Tax=Eisenbergiella porci TaxID=2652274 RepID=UPI0022E46D85|nr:sigma factor-like helix-turn-helix DNA-binding protein [Eisenbergiella porci]